jgi:bifunctional DNA-binding transcriptional regulator/antitoxin component of YhaV-PrlF toxin-antitoxin module
MKPKRQGNERRTRRLSGARPAFAAPRVARARKMGPVAPADGNGVIATTRLSAKNQITLPVRMVRSMGLKAGDEVDITVIDADAVVVSKALRGKALIRRLRGSMGSAPWDTHEAIEGYVKAEREAWRRPWDE